MAKSSGDKHVITYETKKGTQWAEQTISLSSRVNLGRVLVEMRSQNGLIRNVKLVQSATC